MGAFAQPVVEHERPEDLVPPLDRDVGLDDLVPEIRQDSGDGLDGAGDRGIDRTSVRASEEGDPPVPHRGAFEGRLGEDLRHDAGVVHRPGQRADGDEISHRAETPFVRARSGGRLEPHESAEGRRDADGPAAVRAERDRRETGADGSRGATARTARRTGRIPRVPGLPAEQVVAGRGLAELGYVGLAGHHRARGAQPGDGTGVGPGDPPALGRTTSGTRRTPCRRRPYRSNGPPRSSRVSGIAPSSIPAADGCSVQVPGNLLEGPDSLALERNRLRALTELQPSLCFFPLSSVSRQRSTFSLHTARSRIPSL